MHRSFFVQFSKVKHSPRAILTILEAFFCIFHYFCLILSNNPWEARPCGRFRRSSKSFQINCTVGVMDLNWEVAQTVVGTPTSTLELHTNTLGGLWTPPSPNMEVIPCQRPCRAENWPPCKCSYTQHLSMWQPFQLLGGVFFQLITW